MALTEVVVKNIKPNDKVFRIFDEKKAWYLEVSPTGGKWWRFK